MPVLFPRVWLLSLLLAAFSLLGAGSAHAQSIEISSVSGSGLNPLATNSARTYNFGITTLGAGQSLVFTNIGIYINRATGTADPFTVTIYSGLGGPAGGGAVVTNYSIAATNVTQGQTAIFNLLLTNTITLSNGNYSLQLTTTTPDTANTRFGIRQGTLRLLDSNGTTALPIDYWVPDDNILGTAGTNIQAAFVLADYQVTTTNVNLGNYRVGSTLTTNVTLTNTAPPGVNSTNGNVTEQLSAVATASNSATVSGLSTNLLARAATTNFTVGLSTANVGTNSGTVNLAYTSLTNGTASSRAGGATNVGSQSIAVTGVGYRLAEDAVSTTNVNLGNFRIVDGPGTGTVTITNTATNDGFSEGLGVANNGTTGSATVTNVPGSLIAAGGNSSVTVGLSTANAGTNSGTVTFGFDSDGAGTSGFAATNIGTQAVNVVGVGYRLANESVSTTNLNLGRFHIGYNTNMGSRSGTVGITNTATGDGFSEGLAVANNGTAGGATVGGIAGSLIATGANANITLSLGSVSVVGTNSGSVTLGFQSSGTGTSGFAATNIGTQVVNVVAQGYSGQAVWSTANGGSWNNFDNWDVPGGTPGIDGVLSTNDTASFGNAISSARTVSLNGQSPVLTSLSFSNASASYTVAQGPGGAITMGTESAAQTVITNAAGNHTVSAAISLARATQVGVATDSRLSLSAINGSQTLNKSGAGTLTITGNGNLSGSTSVTGGTLNVNGSISNSAVTVANGAILSGSGAVGAISGAGVVSPGNSPGILTSPSVDPSGGLTFHFEFTDLNPVFTTPSNSVNDVLRLTDTANPFIVSLTSANAVNIYFNDAGVSIGRSYTGAFFTDTRADFLDEIVNAEFTYYVADESGPVSYNGVTYRELDSALSVNVSTVSQTADFGDGDINGQITRLEVIPEPSTYALLAMAAAGLGAHWLRRRKQPRSYTGGRSKRIHRARVRKAGWDRIDPL